MTYTNTPAVVSQQTTSYSSGNIPYTSIAVLADIPHTAQLEVERIFTTDRDGSAATILTFLADPAITTAQKKAVFIIPITRCTLNTTTKNITAINLPQTGDVYNYIAGAYTIKVPILSSSTVTVRRKTVSNEPLVNWVPGSRLTSKQLNLSATQSLYLVQEALENIGTSLTIQTTQITAASLAVDAVNTINILNGAVTSAKIADGTIVNADINASAGIVDTKLATIATAGKVSNSATTATTSTTAATIALRDSNGIVPSAFIQTGTGATTRTVDAKLKDTVSVKDFGAVGDGVADDGNAIRLAVTAVAANGGGQVYLPTGTYKVTTAVGDVSNTAIYVPSNVRIFGASQVGTKIVPGANNVVCFRITGLNGGIENLQIDNPSFTYTSVSGIRLAPTDETQTTTRTDVEFNCITNISIRQVSEAIVLKCGPRVGGADSYCYYNSFTNIDIRNCTLGVWLKIPNGGDPGSGVNRNRFVNLRVGETGTNTGLQIDAGDTNTFVGCSFEGIQSGVSPSATPTAIVVAYNTASYGCTDNKFYGLTIEGCTRSVSNINDILEFYGWYDSTNTYNTPAPVGALPLAVDMSRGNSKSLNTVGTTSLVRGTASPATSVDLQLNAGGETIGGRDTGSNTNQNFSIDISKGVGAYRFNEFKSGTQSLWTWGDFLSSYASVMRINNPLNANFYFGQNDTDRVFLNGTGYQPVSDNAYTLGAAANRWSVVYAGTGAINTSDEREKQQIKPIDPAALRAWAKVEYCEFKFNNAVALKGDRARWHIGVIAQKVKEAFESEGLDAFTYGLLCYDQWNEIVEDVLEEVNVTLDDGTIVKGAKPTGEKRVVLQSGNRYGIRYEQALALECAYLRSKIQGV